MIFWRPVRKFYLHGNIFPMKKQTIILLVSSSLSLCGLLSCGESARRDNEESTKAINSIEETSPKYQSEEGKFAVAFEGEPQVTSQEVPTQEGTINVFLFSYQKSINEVHMVGYSDYPPDLVALQDPVEMMKSAEMGLVKDINGVATDEKTTEFDGYLSFEFRASGTEDGESFNLAYKFIMAGNRLYQIAIMKQSEEITNEEVKRFVGSFEFLKN